VPELDLSSDQIDEATSWAKMSLLDTTFRPSAPVNRDELFSGRHDQRVSIFEAIRSPGQHAVIFGERGVGKTSLATTCAAVTMTDGRIPLIVTCDGGDNFHGIWQKFVDECVIYLADHPNHAEDLEVAMERAAEVLRDDSIGPAQVRLALHHILTVAEVVVVIDEFNEINDPDTSALVSNMIKMLSDKVEPVTFVIVGVSENVDQLIRNRQSIGRNLAQIRMPRMAPDELETIARKGFEVLGIGADHDVYKLIRTIPRGLPQYAHIIAQEGARQALMRRSLGITVDDTLNGLRVGLEKVDHTLSAAYEEATYSARASRFKEVLLACALTEPDEFGYFTPANVRLPYSQVTGEVMDIPNFNPQLAIFAQERGEILVRTGSEKRWRYRFSEPLMEPYVLLKGLDDGKITPDQILGHAVEPIVAERLFDLPPTAPQP